MSGGLQILDIIVLFAVAVFVLLYLRRILGRRSEIEDDGDQPIGMARQQPDQDNVIPLPGVAGRGQAPGAGLSLGSVELDNAVERIRSVDRAFDPQQFLSGAKAAYEMIIQAYANGNRADLRSMVSSDVFASFDGAIAAREQAGQTLERVLVSLKSCDIVDIEFDNKLASVTVRYVSLQVDCLRDSAGNRLDEDGDTPIEIIDVWTYAKNMRSRDPNWTLIATRSAS